MIALLNAKGYILDIVTVTGVKKASRIAGDLVSTTRPATKFEIENCGRSGF